MDSLSLEGGEALSGDPLVALQLRCALAEERAADAESEVRRCPPLLLRALALPSLTTRAS
ncbi:MAG: hypothetical protein EOO65_01985 [Methanosarcinales archaeon]|nr:MAG: hypothetical protein EOO65_01985 [Methanosarcinales archaeon]